MNGEWRHSKRIFSVRYTTAVPIANKATVQRQINATDRQIDNLVYDLYGLTDACPVRLQTERNDIRIVEEATER